MPHADEGLRGQGSGIILYRDSKALGGIIATFNTGGTFTLSPGIANKQASSVAVKAGWSVVLYENNDCTGRNIFLDQSADLPLFNDMAGCVKIISPTDRVRGIKTLCDTCYNSTVASGETCPTIVPFASLPDERLTNPVTWVSISWGSLNTGLGVWQGLGDISATSAAMVGKRIMAARFVAGAADIANIVLSLAEDIKETIHYGTLAHIFVDPNTGRVNIWGANYQGRQIGMYDCQVWGGSINTGSKFKLVRSSAEIGWFWIRPTYSVSCTGWADPPGETQPHWWLLSVVGEPDGVYARCPSGHENELWKLVPAAGNNLYLLVSKRKTADDSNYHCLTRSTVTTDVLEMRPCDLFNTNQHWMYSTNQETNGEVLLAGPSPVTFSRLCYQTD